MMNAHPDIDVIVATRDRHELLLATLAAIKNQDYPGRIRTLVVYDNYPSRPEIENESMTRPVSVLSNARAPGLPGSRNTGLELATAPFVAFCDDDDMWLPAKAQKQVRLMQQHDALGSVTGIRILYGETTIDRVPNVSEISTEAILGSRLTGAHPSSYMFARERLLADVGLVDESIPFGYGEDYDLLIRAVASGPVLVLQEPAVEVLWHKGGSYFSRRWEAMDAGVDFLVSKHPGLTSSRRAAGWLYGQRAFAQAAGGHRRASLKTAFRAARRDPTQPRAYLAAGVALGLLRPQWIVDQLNARGHGI